MEQEENGCWAFVWLWSGERNQRSTQNGWQENGNSPTHIIVSHSFAGGSGSGMVLPVLQLLRSIFDADAMIWVVSVGEGLAENRISAAYNTPFILSDVLQAHYDGIHSAIDPFRVGEWDGNKTELTSYFERMIAEISNIKSSLKEDGELITEKSLSRIVPRHIRLKRSVKNI